MSGKHIRQKPREGSQRRGRPPQMTQPKHHDTYARKAKSVNTRVCDQCGVVYHAGRWYWGEPPQADVIGGLCPACERIRDRYPAGTIRLPQDFLAHRDEVLNLIRNAEQAEMAEHPLERLMGMEDKDDGLVVTTTGLHLARAITNKLERRFHKQAQIRYPDEENLIYVHWET